MQGRTANERLWTTYPLGSFIKAAVTLIMVTTLLDAVSARAMAGLDL